jgi:hypothetical protein
VLMHECQAVSVTHMQRPAQQPTQDLVVPTMPLLLARQRLFYAGQQLPFLCLQVLLNVLQGQQDRRSVAYCSHVNSP